MSGVFGNGSKTLSKYLAMEVKVVGNGGQTLSRRVYGNEGQTLSHDSAQAKEEEEAGQNYNENRFVRLC